MKIFMVMVGFALSASILAGCTASYPDLSNIQRVAGDALTPSELKETINDLALEQKKHRSETTTGK